MKSSPLGFLPRFSLARRSPSLHPRLRRQRFKARCKPSSMSALPDMAASDASVFVATITLHPSHSDWYSLGEAAIAFLDREGEVLGVWRARGLEGELHLSANVPEERGGVHAASYIPQSRGGLEEIGGRGCSYGERILLKERNDAVVALRPPVGQLTTELAPKVPKKFIHRNFSGGLDRRTKVLDSGLHFVIVGAGENDQSVRVSP